MSTQHSASPTTPRTSWSASQGETGGHVEYPLNSLYKDVSGYLSTPSDEGNYALTVGTGGYAAEISGAIIKAVGGIGGEVTTPVRRALQTGCGPGDEGQGIPPHQGGNPDSAQRQDSARNGYYVTAVPGAQGSGPVAAQSRVLAMPWRFGFLRPVGFVVNDVSFGRHSRDAGAGNQNASGCPRGKTRTWPRHISIRRRPRQTSSQVPTPRRRRLSASIWQHASRSPM